MEISQNGTSSVKIMTKVFTGSYIFNQDLNDWDTSQVRTMEGIFFNDITNKISVFNGNISNWDTSQVTNMDRMFENAHSFNQYIGGWDTSSLQIFKGATAFQAKYT